MSICCTEAITGYPILEIDHPAVRARVALHGAHLMEWTPAGQAAGLYLSPDAVYQPGKPIRGGVPVCWPWFGPSTVDSSLPMHGFARIRFWEPGEFSEDETGVTLKFTLNDDEETRRLWPHAFRLELTISLGATLRLALRMMNPGDAPYTITGALHTYLTVGDIHQVTVSGLSGVDYLDTVGTPARHRQEGDLVFDREIDRGYDTASPITLHDPALQRDLIITGTGSHSAVVWNPWIAKSRLLADLPDEAYLRFLCVETANAREDSVTVPPGGMHELTTTIRVERLGESGSLHCLDRGE